MTRDRLKADEFRLTQDFMSNMLGVRREGVNKAAGALQARKLISYNRGKLKIVTARLGSSCLRLLRDHQNRE